MTDPTVPMPVIAPAPVSPTGKPLMPPFVVPIVGVIVAAAGVGIQFVPPHTILWHVCAFIGGLAGLLGIASPGLRSKPG